MTNPAIFTSGTEKQIAFAGKIRAALIKRVVETKMLKVDAATFETLLAANVSRDAAKWIDEARRLDCYECLFMDNGWINIDPPAFLTRLAAVK